MNLVLLAGVVGALALVSTAVLTPVVRAAAIRGGMVRGSQKDRWHERPTPAIGGIAIYAGFVLALAVGYLIDPDTTRQFGIDAAPRAILPLAPWHGLLLGASIAFVLGVVDDFLALPAGSKLLWQVVAASMLLATGIGLWLTGVYIVDVVISLFWFIGVTNAVNLLDNMDGVAAGVAGIAAAYLAVIFGLEGQLGLAVFASALAMSLFGFLAHNYPPARIFMGDSGSLFIGMAVAGLALAPAPGGSRSVLAVLAAPALILGVPILDTTVVTIGRLLEGKPVSQGGRDHTTHLFVQLGLPEKRTAWLLWGLAAAGGAVGLLLRSADRGTAVVLGGVLVAMLSLVGGYMLTVRMRRMEEGGAKAPPMYRWLIRSQTRYPVLAVLLDGVWIAIAYYAAYLLRWDPVELPAQLPYFESSIVIYVSMKLLGLVLSGIYDMRWASFGLFDAVRMTRANVFATLLGVGALFLLQREGLSRGVIAIDFLACTLLTSAGRLTSRVIEGTTRHLSEDGLPVVVLSTENHAKSVVAQLSHIDSPRLKAVAIADPDAPASRARVGALPLFGGKDALERAIAETRATAVLLVGRGSEGHPHLHDHLERHGALDVFSYRVSVEPMRLGGD